MNVWSCSIACTVRLRCLVCLDPCFVRVARSLGLAVEVPLVGDKLGRGHSVLVQEVDLLVDVDAWGCRYGA